MEKITSLIQQLKKNNPDITFTASDEFGWNPQSRVVSYDETSNRCTAYLLHELGHALLGHNTYERDIDLIAMERDAWSKAREESERYNSPIAAELIEDALDTYRDWMHARSLCPSCSATGIQTSKSEYTCIACRARWKVNEARRCALKRYKIK